MAMNNAPAGRTFHTAVWTGSEMIVWGGYGTSGYLNDGARYNPVSDTWTATPVNNAPSARDFHTGVWTGSEMIIWGGHNAGSEQGGARYNPAANVWKTMTVAVAPPGRQLHTAVWTGSEMIIWGGVDNNGNNFNDTYSYSPSSLMYLYLKP